MSLRIVRVKLDRGGYDRHGRYYGAGEKLWCAPDTAGATHGPKCVRARDKVAAKAAFKREHSLDGLPRRRRRRRSRR